MRVPCFPPTCHYDTDAQKRTRSMRITPAPICGNCGREGHHGPKSCGECGGNMVPINTIPFFIALLVTRIPLALGPATVLLIEFSGDQHKRVRGPRYARSNPYYRSHRVSLRRSRLHHRVCLAENAQKTLPRARCFIRPWHRRSNRRNPGNPRHGRRLRPNPSRPSRRSHCAV